MWVTTSSSTNRSSRAYEDNIQTGYRIETIENFVCIQPVVPVLAAPGMLSSWSLRWRLLPLLHPWYLVSISMGGVSAPFTQWGWGKGLWSICHHQETFFRLQELLLDPIFFIFSNELQSCLDFLVMFIKFQWYHESYEKKSVHIIQLCEFSKLLKMLIRCDITCSWVWVNYALVYNVSKPVTSQNIFMQKFKKRQYRPTGKCFNSSNSVSKSCLCSSLHRHSWVI